MKSLRNIIAGLLIGFSLTFGLASVSYDWLHPGPYYTAPNAPNPATGAIYPYNRHGTFIYYTAQEQAAERLRDNVGWMMLGVFAFGLLVQPKQNIQSKTGGCFPFASIKTSWSGDDPHRLFAICGIASAILAIWFVFSEMAPLIARLTH